MSIFNEVYDFVVQANKDMPILTTIFGSAASVGFGGLLWFLPSKLWGVIKRSCFVELIISPNSTTGKLCSGKITSACDMVQEWVFNYEGLKLSRVSQYKGIDETTFDNIYGIGFGTHYVFWEGRPYAITLEQIRINSSGALDGQAKMPVEIRIRTIGRSDEPIINLIEEIVPKQDKAITVNNHFDSTRFNSSVLRPRTLDSIITTGDNKERILDTIDNFIENKEWYNKRYINHTLGMLFYGKPGTGKTSFIRALATEYGYDIDIVSLNTMNKEGLMSIFKQVTNNSIIVLEDIDCVAVTNNRETVTITDIDEEKITLSDLLNAIDGVDSPEDCIIIATTNHIEKLDPAILRAGRFGYHFEFDYFGYDQIQEYTKLIYDSEIENLPRDCKKIAPCDLQQIMLANIDNKEDYVNAVLSYDK